MAVKGGSGLASWSAYYDIVVVGGGFMHAASIPNERPARLQSATEDYLSHWAPDRPAGMQQHMKANKAGDGLKWRVVCIRAAHSPLCSLSLRPASFPPPILPSVLLSSSSSCSSSSSSFRQTLKLVRRSYAYAVHQSSLPLLVPTRLPVPHILPRPPRIDIHDSHCWPQSGQVCWVQE